MHRNMNEMIPAFVYEALDRFGNTIISMTRYKKFGEKRILDALKKRGYICNIYISEYDIEPEKYGIPVRKKHDQTCIIELKEKCDASV